MKVRFSRQAQADLRSIIQAIHEHSPAAARRYGQLLRDRALSLRDFPERGARLQAHTTARRLVVGAYLIIYRPDPELVRILRILHGKRDIDALLAGEPRDDPDREH
jgi:toxin ParE1/3/4